MLEEYFSLLSAAGVGGGNVWLGLPVPYISAARGFAEKLGVCIGAQDASRYSEGAYTGEISADMLRDVGAQFVIVGHSERRRIFGDVDDIVREKYRRAVLAGLIPVLCVGETLAERDAGYEYEVVGRQLMAAINYFSSEEGGFNAPCIIAYEPVWAIGTGRTALLEDVEAMHSFILDRLPGAKVLYGGSVKPDSVRSLFQIDSVAGVLVGGASLSASSFASICGMA